MKDKYYKCVKPIEVPFYDSEANITNKKMIIPVGRVFYKDDKNNNPIEADITLYDTKNGNWLGISNKTFKENFSEVSND